MSETNKALMRRFYDEVLNQSKLAALDELLAPDFVDHSPVPGQPPGIEGVRQIFAAMLAAFPDGRYTVEHMVAEGDKVAAHLNFVGTHRGPFMGAAPTGRQVSARISDVVRFANGKAVERWGVEDMSGMMQALGISAPPPA